MPNPADKPKMTNEKMLELHRQFAEEAHDAAVKNYHTQRADILERRIKKERLSDLRP